MLRRCVFVIVVMLGAVAGPGMPSAHAQQDAQPPAPQPGQAQALVEGSTTQPVQVTILNNTPAETAAQAERRRLFDELSETELGRIIQGEKELTWDDIRKPGFWFVTIRNLAETLLAFIPRLIGTLIFLFVFWLIYRGVRRVAMGSMKPGEVDSSIRDLLGAMIKWLVMGFGIVIACNQLGIPIVAMLTGVSLIGLAVGFAAQETLANFIAGIVIFIDKPFRIGDWIEIEGTFGQVRRVTFRSTRILTLDGEVVVLPNTQVLSSKFSNHSTNPINRVNIPIGIAYKCSIDDARRVLLEMVRGDERIVSEPGPEVVVTQLGDSSVNLTLRFWIADESIERRIGYEYTEKAKKALDAAGLEIPFPHMQLFIENTAAVEALAGGGNGKTRAGFN